MSQYPRAAPGCFGRRSGTSVARSTLTPPPLTQRVPTSVAITVTQGTSHCPCSVAVLSQRLRLPWLTLIASRAVPPTGLKSHDARLAVPSQYPL